MIHIICPKSKKNKEVLIGDVIAHEKRIQRKTIIESKQMARR
jgi:hypothetical protein